MSAFPGILGSPIFGGYWPGLGTGGLYGSNIAVLDDARDTPKPTDPVKPQDPIDRSYTITSLTAMASYPGFDAAPPGSFYLYWQMRRHSTIVLAHTICWAPIFAGTQTIEIIGKPRNAKLAERVKEAAEADLLPTVMDWLPGMAECQHFGQFLQEIEWDRVNGRTVPVAYHSILPGEAILYRDQYRRLTGYQVGGVYRDARYALHAVEQPHVDPIFGFPRNENVREEWWRIRQGEANADKMERKASGIQMGVGIPMGSTFYDDNNKPVMPQTMAQTIINAAATGQTFTYPLTPFAKSDIKANPQLADIPAVKLEQFDWGNIGPAMEAHLARGDKLRVDLMRGWHRPEREAMAGKAGGGTNAESETQGEIGTTDSELVAAQAMRQFTRQVLDRWAVTNFGPEAAGLVRIRQAPLSDPQQKFLQQVANALVSDRNTGPEFQSNIDQRALIERVEIPMVSEEDAAKKLANVKAQQQQQAAQQQMQLFPGDPGQDSVTGKKKADPNLKAAKRLLQRAGVTRARPSRRLRHRQMTWAATGLQSTASTSLSKMA